MRNIDTIIVHCSDTEVGTVESIRRFHKSVRGWDDIGYHYVIYKDGTIHEGRPINQPGAHCQGANANSIGICLIGVKNFTPPQFGSLKKLCTELRGTYPINKIAGHREFASAKKQGKTCPNFEVKDIL